MFIHSPMFSETVLFFRLMCFQQCFNATENHEGKCFIQHTDVCNGPEIWWLLSLRKKCLNLVVQFISGRPKGPLPEGSHCSSIRRAQRSWGRFMIWQANFQCSKPQVSAYVFMWHAPTTSRTRWFQVCKISYHGSPQQIPSRAPTTHRIIRRKLISSLTRSVLWMHRGPAPKQAIGVTMALKNLILFLMDTFRLKNINLLAKKGSTRRL